MRLAFLAVLVLPGIMTGDYLYVSGQSAAKHDGSFPAEAEAQVLQCLRNVQAVLETAGLTMRHVVYAQVYLTDISTHDALDRAWRKVFPMDPPARSVLGVHRLAADTPVEISVVAYRHLSRRRTITLPGHAVPAGVLVDNDRLYLSDSLGHDAELALDGMEATLKAAGMDFRHLVFVNPYLTEQMTMAEMNTAYAKRFEFGNTPARATIRAASLPGGNTIAFTGVAVRDLSKRRAVRPKNMPPSPTASPCVFAGDTYYCSAKSGFIPGPNGGLYASTVETQLRQTMRNLLDGLEEAGLTLDHVVATNIYLDNMDDAERVNKVFAEYFPKTPPARTVVQQVKSAERKPDARGRWPALEQISLIAVK